MSEGTKIAESAPLIEAPRVLPAALSAASEPRSHFASHTSPLRRRFVLYLLVTLGLAVISTALEPQISPWHSLRVLSGEIDQRSAQVYLTAVARILGVILAATVTLCGIAIPLTANNYTPKLITLFVKDRVNWLMFTLLVVANTCVHWTLLNATGLEVPVLHTALSGLLAMVSIALVIPYAFHVFRSLDPEIIVSHIEREIAEDLERATARPEADELWDARARVLENLKYLSNIVLRSIDRHDRDTTLHGLEALRRVAAGYSDRKARLPAAWFRVSPHDFPSKSPDAVRGIEEGGTVFETEFLEELMLILSLSIGAFRDGVRMIGVMLEHAGIRAQKSGDAEVSELVRIYFNSFLRAAISRRNPEAIYMLVHHYRDLAERFILDAPEESERIAFYLDYYAHQAVRTGIVFVANLIAFDLSTLAKKAYALAAPCRERIFEIFINFDRDESIRNFPGVLKSHIKLAIALQSGGHTREVDRIVEELETVRLGLVSAAIAEIESVTTPYYWEVTDRRLHLDYVAPELSEAFAAVKARFLERAEKEA